jgi:hypothetical protein
MEFIVAQVYPAKSRETKKGEKFNTYPVRLETPLRKVTVGGLTKMQRESIFFDNAEPIKEGTKLNVPLGSVEIVDRQVTGEDGVIRTFAWMRIKKFSEGTAVAEKAAATTKGATV